MLHLLSQLTQRRVALAMMSILLLGSTIIAPASFLFGMNEVALLTTITILVYAPLLFSYWNGWEPARYIFVVFVSLFVPLSMPRELFLIGSPVVLLVPAIALVLTDPRWVMGSFLLSSVIFIWRADGQDPYYSWLFWVVIMFSLSAMLLTRIIADNLWRTAETNALQAEIRGREALEARALSEQRLNELEIRHREQERLLELISILETPTIELTDGVLLAPVVGNLDTRRTQMLMTRLLNEVNIRRARVVVIDIAGVPLVDTHVSQALIKLVQALQLLGCRATITGISAQVATALTQLGLRFEDVPTARSPQEVLLDHVSLRQLS
jgi:anti-anti-sigma regulatory factor